jgi:putative SOS response-associated peptidase YedK
MCYYNGIKLTRQEFILLKDFEKSVADYPFLNNDLNNGFDYGNSPVLKKIDNKRDFEIVEMQWGFLPHYIRTKEQADKFRNGYKKENGQWQQPILTLNATSEELLFPKKIFRDAALNRRCLVLSSGFYEWQHVFPLSKRSGKPLKTAIKYPYHIGLRDKEYFYMAGIWQPWKDVETGEYVETFSIVTTKANSLMEKIHNSKKRMPVILTEDLASEWLMEDLDEKRIAEIGGFQIPASEMEACTIAKDFRTAANPSEKFEYKELQEIQLNKTNEFDF